MSDKIDYKKIQAIVESAIDTKLSHYPTNAEFGQILERTFEDKLGENFKERLNRIEDNTDRACKISKDTREEQVLTQSKVDKHENQIIELQTFTGLISA